MKIYENLASLNALGLSLLRGLHPLATDAVDEIRHLSPNFPGEYIAFLRECGHGVISEDDSSFPLLVVKQRPIDAANEYFGDNQIYSDGPTSQERKGLFGSLGWIAWGRPSALIAVMTGG